MGTRRRRPRGELKLQTLSRPFPSSSTWMDRRSVSTRKRRVASRYQSSRTSSRTRNRCRPDPRCDRGRWLSGAYCRFHGEARLPRSHAKWSRSVARTRWTATSTTRSPWRWGSTAGERLSLTSSGPDLPSLRSRSARSRTIRRWTRSCGMVLCPTSCLRSRPG